MMQSSLSDQVPDNFRIGSELLQRRRMSNILAESISAAEPDGISSHRLDLTLSNPTCVP
jgi:hypothetical protein